MFWPAYARNDQVQIVKLSRIDLDQGSRKEVRLFLVVSLEHNPVAADNKGFEASTTFAFGSTEPFIQGWTSFMRCCFSSRRVVQERNAGSEVCTVIEPLLCKFSS
jgi:hypothetical protein